MDEPRIPGGMHRRDEADPSAMLRRVLAEQYAERLLDALDDLVHGRAQARPRAMVLLRLIDAGHFPRPRP